MSEGARLDALDRALVEAAGQNRAGEVADLMRRGARVRVGDAAVPSALRVAVVAGHEEAVRALLAGGADASERCARTGDSLLHAAAAWNEDTRVADALLDAGADPSAASLAGVSPLVCAIMAERAATVARLLERGADPNAPTLRMVSPLHYAASRRGAVSEGLALLLLQYGAAPRPVDLEGFTPAALALDHGTARALGEWARGRHPLQRQRDAAVAALLAEPRSLLPDLVRIVAGYMLTSSS